MPRFYFQISHGAATRLPDEGLELPDLKAAWAEATAACGEILKDLNGDLRPGDIWSMTVKDAAGTDVYQIELRTTSFIL